MPGILSFIAENFAHVFPILAAAAIAAIIMIERARALVFQYPLARSRAFFDKIRELVMTDRLSDAIALCDRYPGKPVAVVVKEGLQRAHQPESLIEHGLQIAVGEAAEKITSRTAFLATIANVATLLGLFGTILGLVQSFEAVGNANAQARSAMLAAGISTAMNATLLGLGVAIPCMVGFSYLMNRTNRLTGELDRAAVKVLDLLKQRYYRSDTPPPEEQTNSGLIPHSKGSRRAV